MVRFIYLERLINIMLLKKQAFPIKGISEHQLIFCGFGATLLS